MTVQRGLAASGIGFTVLPSVAVTKDVSRGVLRNAPLLDDGLRRRLQLAPPRTRRIGHAVRAVADMLANEMRGSVEKGAWPSARWLGR